MNSMFAKYREQLKRLSGEFTTGQKTVVLLVVLGVLVGALAFSQFSSSESKTVLFAGLSAEDAAAVTAELQGQNVSYSLANNGTTVLVPASKVAQLRIDLAAKSLPSSGSKGWSIIDSEGMTTSEFRQRIDYQRALEGELVKTIQALDPVNTAMVRLVVPRNDVFAADSQKPTASVVVVPKAGQVLTSSQVQSIVNITAGSVPGLQAGDVTVTDSSGRLLAAPGIDGAAAGLDGNAATTAAYETKVAQGVTELLAPVFGTDNVHVKVAATLNYDKRSSVSETVQAPNPQVPTSTKTETETLAGNGAVGGVLGPDGTPLTANGTASNYNRQANDTQYAVGKVTETVQDAPGAVEQLSIAVVLDRKKAQGINVTQIRDLVAASTGLNAQRGDSVQISTLPFDKSAIAQAEAERKAEQGAQSQAQLLAMARTIAVWLIIGVFVLLILRSVRRARMVQLAASLEPRRPRAAPTPAPTPIPEPVIDESEIERERLEEQVRSASEVLRAAPSSDVAAVMRAWAQES